MRWNNIENNSIYHVPEPLVYLYYGMADVFWVRYVQTCSRSIHVDKMYVHICHGTSLPLALVETVLFWSQISKQPSFSDLLITSKIMKIEV